MFLAIVQLLGGVRAACFALCAVLALGGAGVQTWRLGHAQDAAERSAQSALASALSASEAARHEEQTRARYIAGVDAAYEKGKADAKAQGDRVAADLRTGNERLRHLWQGCARVPGPAADSGVADAEDGLRAASAGRIVGAVAACQAERDALLGVAEADRAKVKP
jgi:uncharacterized protein HemX